MPMLSVALILFVLGAACGSFINALLWRLHEQTKKGKKKANLSIINGRSICPNCNHQLAWYDLVPLVSWLILGGKCRYCKKAISPQYPLVELLTALVFALSYVLWPSDLNVPGQVLLLVTWLIVSIGLIALAIYDLKWTLLPNRIIYPTLVVAVLGRGAYVLLYEKNVWHALFLWAFSVVIASGVFFALYTISKGKWIGFGDVRLGLITGTVLADPQKSLAMLFLASLIGTVIILPSLATKKRNLASRLPFGPFLIAATAILVIYGDSLLDWYKGLIL
jgi:prepilin signal peptidase PulO-like enzyme (type II secretory pathway)